MQKYQIFQVTLKQRDILLHETTRTRKIAPVDYIRDPFYYVTKILNDDDKKDEIFYIKIIEGNSNNHILKHRKY